MSASEKQVAFLLHLARMAHQIAARIPWEDLVGEDRMAAERIAALLNIASETIAEALKDTHVV